MSDSPNKESVLAEGLYFELPKEGAPDFVKGRLSIDVNKFQQFLQANKNNGGYVNINLKVSKGLKGYAVLDTWKPSDAGKPNFGEPSQATPDEPAPEDIPF